MLKELNVHKKIKKDLLLNMKNFKDKGTPFIAMTRMPLNSRFVFLLMLSGALLSCHQGINLKNLPDPEFIPGQIITNPLGSYYLPKGFTPEKNYPLIVLLHPMGSSHVNFFLAHDWRGQADRRGYILCAPKSRLTYWEDDGTDGESVTRMILYMKRNFPVDHRRIALFGFSSGAHFAHTMVLLNREPVTGRKLFTAWIAGSGGPGYQWDRCFRKGRVGRRYRIPGFIFWGEQEVPPPGREIAEFLITDKWEITAAPHPGGHWIPEGYIDKAFDWFDTLPLSGR